MLQVCYASQMPVEGKRQQMVESLVISQGAGLRALYCFRKVGLLMTNRPFIKSQGVSVSLTRRQDKATLATERNIVSSLKLYSH